MKKVFTLNIVFVLFVLYSFSSDKLLSEFTDMLNSAGMFFEKPEGMKEVKPIENAQMNYEYALKIPKKRFEVRYAVRRLDKMVAEYNEWEKNKKDGETRLNPNKLYSSLLQVTVLNISGGLLPEITEFDKAAVKKEFNADWGATVLVEAGKEFGQDYKYCMVVAIHKDDIADAYYFYMGDDKQVIIDNMMLAFHSLQFKK